MNLRRFIPISMAAAFARGRGVVVSYYGVRGEVFSPERMEITESL